jgi:hypothetical protein
MRNTVFAAALAVPFLLFANSPSMAQVDVDIGIGTPGIYVNPRNRSYEDDYPDRRRGRLRCWEAKQLVRERGYRDVRTIECEGRVYTFEGRRRGNEYEISVNSRTGAVWRR